LNPEPKVIPADPLERADHFKSLYETTLAELTDALRQISRLRSTVKRLKGEIADITIRMNGG
jgi:hypothetical protein